VAATLLTAPRHAHRESKLWRFNQVNPTLECRAILLVPSVGLTLVASPASGLPLAEERGAAAAAPPMLLTAARSAADVPPRRSEDSRAGSAGGPEYRPLVRC